ncbi:MAG: exonuclease subunit SbcD [Weeksellaceae bacterium]|jgi:exonuclease SbcD|nr:exonuclease subunit SbcD [Weeksellaceae bacterium]MDX9704758.1 exonuclease subunit SbcD [Weeksellaceae bacterium]
MKILHTADWHLGKKLDRFSRFEEQQKVMSEIIEIADEHKVDLVLVAGDLFDHFNPTVEAMDLFYQTLVKLSKNGERPLIAIAGNHDSPALIDTPNSLARANGIILIGQPKAVVQKFELAHFKITHSDEGFLEIQLKNQNFPVRLLHTAYANEVRLKQYLGENKETALNTVLSEHWQKLTHQYCDEKGVNLLLSHLYMNVRGKTLLEEPDSEKPIKIGNADLIYSESIPKQIQYTALGHLHEFNNIGTDERPIVYSSSILNYSFSEAGQQKYVVILEAEPDKEVKFEKIPLKNGRKLERVSFTNVEEAAIWLKENPNSLVELTLETEEFLKAEERQKIFQSHDGIIHLIPKIKPSDIRSNKQEKINLSLNEKELFRLFFQSKKGQEPNDELMDLLNEILSE